MCTISHNPYIFTWPVVWERMEGDKNVIQHFSYKYEAAFKQINLSDISNKEE